MNKFNLELTPKELKSLAKKRKFKSRANSKHSRNKSSMFSVQVVGGVKSSIICAIKEMQQENKISKSVCVPFVESAITSIYDDDDSTVISSMTDI